MLLPFRIPSGAGWACSGVGGGLGKPHIYLGLPTSTLAQGDSGGQGFREAGSCAGGLVSASFGQSLVHWSAPDVGTIFVFLADGSLSLA